MRPKVESIDSLTRGSEAGSVQAIRLAPLGISTRTPAGSLSEKLRATCEARFTAIAISVCDVVGHPDGVEGAAHPRPRERTPYSLARVRRCGPGANHRTLGTCPYGILI